jgi:hypothetical protein
MPVQTEDGRHAMVAVPVPLASADPVVRATSGVHVLVERTDLHPVGNCASEYVGRHVRIVAKG